MLIPKFSLSQDDQFVIVVMTIPYLKISKSEFYIEKFTFKFFLQPYSLTLTFKNQLKEAEDPAHASYNHNTYELTVKLLKQNQGELFEDLNMITELLSKRKDISDFKRKRKAKPVIEVLNEEGGYEEVKQKESEVVLNQYFYGFNNQTTGFFENLEEQIVEIGEINPDTVKFEERRAIRDDVQLKKFDADSYLFDLLDNEEIQEIISIQGNDLDSFANKLSALKIVDEPSQKKPPASQFAYSEQEMLTLKSLKNKQYQIQSKGQVLLEITDILFAYLYEKFVQCSDFTCESAATINKLSSTLSCFYTDPTLAEVVKTCYRRALIYPLYKHFGIAEIVKQQLTDVLIEGKRVAVLKILLQLHHLFNKSEPRYLLNELYLDDYCVIVQHFSE